MPLTLGHETVGRVVAAGPDAGEIDTSKLHVLFPWCGCGACDVCRAGDENLCATSRFAGIHTNGGHATQIRMTHPCDLFDIGTLSPEQAAPLACLGLTTFSGLKKLGDGPKSQPALLIDAGGLGLMCIQLMQALGMPAPVVAAIARACDRPPTSVLDFVGAEATAKPGFDALGKGGTLVTIGLFGGAAPWSQPMITLKSARILGFTSAR